MSILSKHMNYEYRFVAKDTNYLDNETSFC
jgi:hypothetical protein